MKNRYSPIEETTNLEKTLSEVPEGYELHSVVYMSYFNYAHHYTVIWQKTGHDYNQPYMPGGIDDRGAVYFDTVVTPTNE